MVKTAKPARPYGPGDRVRVAWGLGVVSGRILGVYGHGTAKRVLLSLPVRGPMDEVLDEFTVSLPESAIEDDD